MATATTERSDEMVVGPARIESTAAGSQTLTLPLSWASRKFDLWFRVQGATLSTATSAAIPFTLVPAMKLVKTLRLADPVSPKLLSSVPKIQEIFPVWDHQFEPVQIVSSPTTTQDTSPQRGTGLFFSGGVDSYFSLLRHLDEISHLIFVRGFDIRLGNTSLGDEVAGVIRTAAAELKKPLIEVTTNLRDFSDEFVQWGDDYHGSALSGVALLLSAVLKKAYISSTHTYADLFRWGSHPILDYRWGTESMEIDHDGCDATRVRKVAAIAHHPTVQKTLRVCYRNKGGAYNCGLCEKCLRTMIGLRVAGALEKCQTFRRPLKMGEVRLIRVKDANTASFVSENLRAVEARGDDPKLARALREALSNRYYRHVGHIARAAIDLSNRISRRFEKKA